MRLPRWATPRLEGATLLSRVSRNTEPLIELADELFTSIIAAGASSATISLPRPISKKTNGQPLKLEIRRRSKADWRSW